MAKKKKGPREAVGLVCTVCGNFNYITEINNVNERLKQQTEEKSTFPIMKFCPKPSCRKRTEHKVKKKLK